MSLIKPLTYISSKKYSVSELNISPDNLVKQNNLFETSHLSSCMSSCIVPILHTKNLKNNKQRIPYIKIANIVYNFNNINIQYVFLLENKRNIIMDGKFTKIIYSDSITTMNGIFIYIPLSFDSIHMGYNILNDDNTQSTILTPELRSSANRPSVSGLCPPAPGLIRDFESKFSTKCTGSLYNIKTQLVKDNKIKIKEPYNGFETDTLSKCFLKYDLHYNNENNYIINYLIRLEQQILDFYKQVFHCSKKPTTILKSQLQNGCFKLYVHNNEYIKLQKTTMPYTHNFILKISGIWEDNENIGLTYKFIAQ